VRTSLQLLFVLTFVTLSMSQHRLGVLNFEAGAGVSRIEANRFTNYTVSELEKIPGFEVLKESEISKLSQANNILVDMNNPEVLKRMNIPYLVTGRIERKASKYSVTLSVQDNATGEVTSDMYYLDPTSDQNASLANNQALTSSYRHFITDETGVNEILKPWSMLSAMPLQRFHGSLSLSYSSFTYPASDEAYLKTTYSPVSFMVDFSLSKYVFFILGGSYISVHNSINPAMLGMNPSQDSLVNTIGDFYTAKVGLGFRFWRVRAYFTYEHQLKYLLDATVSRPDLIPDYFTTIGLQVYPFTHLFVGTELMLFVPVEYTPYSVEARSWYPVPSFTIGYQF